MPTKLSHLLYRLVGRDPPDRWVDRSMMPQQQHPERRWTQTFLSPRLLTAGNGDSFSGGGGNLNNNAIFFFRNRGQSVGAATTINDASTATHRGGASKTALPAKIKIRAENERQLEVKIVYNLGGAATAARYKVDIFFFLPAELEPRDSTGWFYLSLYSVVRLHTPRLPLSSLSSRGGSGSEGCLLVPIRNALDAVDAAARAVERAKDELRGDFFAGGGVGDGESSSDGAESEGEEDGLGKRKRRRRKRRRSKCSLLPPTPLACVRRRRLARLESELENRATDAAELMRMHACIFRTAMRSAAAVVSDALKEAAAVVAARKEAGAAATCAAVAAAATQRRARASAAAAAQQPVFAFDGEDKDGACAASAAAPAPAPAAAAAAAAKDNLDDGGENKNCPVVDGAARITLRMVEAVCESLEALSETCERCEADKGALSERGWPVWLGEAWRLVDEFCLLEAERSLLKLLVDIEPVAAAGGGGGGAEENASVAGGSSEEDEELGAGEAGGEGGAPSRSLSPRDRLSVPPTTLGTRSMPPLPVLRQQREDRGASAAGSASSSSMSPASPAALQLMQQQRGAQPPNNNSSRGSSDNAGVIVLSHLLRSPTVPGMGHTLSRSYSLRGLDEESQVALQDVLMSSQRGTSAPPTRQSQQGRQQAQNQLPPPQQPRRGRRSLLSSTPTSSPPSPLPSPPPPVPTAVLSGRYPHLDAVRVSALAHRQSIDVPSSSIDAAASVAVAEEDAARSAFVAEQQQRQQRQQQQRQQQQQQQSPPPSVPPGVLSTAQAASRAARTAAPPPSSLAHAAAPPAPSSAAASAFPSHRSSSSLLVPARRCPPDDPRGARVVLREAVEGLEAARARRGFYDSLLRDGPPQVNERYTARLQALKKHARAAISLTPRTRRPSNVLADMVGMIVAAVAMAFATFTVYLAQRQGPQFDRLKEWGKRYLAPLAAFLSIPLYDRRVEVVDGRGVVVGRVSELVSACDPGSLNSRVLSLRHEGSSLGSHARAAAQPERVLAYSKRVDVKWGSVGARLRGVVALSDVMRFDLTPLRRRMQPAIEAHARLSRRGAGDGRSSAGPPCEAVACARVYHMNVVLRVRAAAPTGTSTLPPEKSKNKDNDSSRRHASLDAAARNALPTAGTMVLERARVVMDQNGIVRLEPAGRSRLAVKPARGGVVAAGLAAWGAGGGGGGGVGREGAAASNAGNVIVVGDRSEGEEPDDDDDEPGLFPVGDEAV